ncbi:hypothetical protein [Lewinella sp. LCG006]|uniref:hypothetical protein n=1 Tax=Lewinella sp. LCG006 TaxID=3231911 RepID=UPI00345F3CCE
MNTPNPHLWKLINGLTPAEKRYFKTHFASSGNQLTLLFDTLNGQEVYDEQNARDVLGVKASQFKVLKHQLQELLMKSWVANSSKRSIKSRIRIGLEEVDLLLEREHFEEAGKKLAYLEQQCSHYGFTLYHYEVRERLHEIQHLELDFSDPEANQHYEELVHLQRVLYQKQQLSAIQQKLEDWNSFTPARHKVLQELKKTLEALKAEYMDLSSWMAWMQNMTICLELLGDEQTATRYREQIMEAYEQEPSLKENLPLGYLTALKHAASPARRLLSIEYVESIALQARHLIARYPQYSPHYIYFLWARIRANYQHKEWGRLIGTLARESKRHLDAYQLGTFRTASKIYVVLGVAHLLKGKFPAAEAYFTAYRKSKMTKDETLNHCVNLLELIMWVEADNQERLRQRIAYFKRKQKKSKQENYSLLYNFHLELFSDICKTPFSKDELTANTLLEVANYPFDPILYYFSFFHIERWLQATATRQPWLAII